MNHQHQKRNGSAINASKKRTLNFENLLDTEQPGSAIRRAMLDASRLSAHDAMVLQRAIGNQATAHLLDSGQSTPAPRIRSNLTAGPFSRAPQQTSMQPIQRKSSSDLIVQRDWKDRLKFWEKNKGPTKPKHERDRLPEEESPTRDTQEIAALMAIAGGGGGLAEGLQSSGGSPVAGGVFSATGAITSGLQYGRGRKRRSAARESGDLAGEKLGKGEENSGKWGMAGGLASLAQGATSLATLIKHGSQGLMTMDKLVSGAKFVSTGVGAAGAGLGIAGGAITAGMGAWKGRKAYKKYTKLGTKTMVSEDGERWHDRIKNREKTKMKFNTLKVIGGGLGIAAGALALASNPVGWALGIGAAATVGGLAAYKLYTKHKKKKRKSAQVKSSHTDMMKEYFESMKEPAEGDESEDWKLHDYGRIWGVDDPTSKNDKGSEPGDSTADSMLDVNPEKLGADKRKQAAELGNRVAKESSQSGAIAWEIRQALGYRKFGGFMEMQDMMENGVYTPQQLRAGYNKDQPYPKQFLMAHDAVTLLGVLNLTPEQAESESGQELIEKKMSVTGSL